MTHARSTTVETLLAHRDWVRALARRLVLDQNQADDLEQQTWLAALRSPPADTSAPRAWLGTVLRNLVRERLRRDGRRVRREQPSTDAGPVEKWPGNTV